MSLLDPLPTLYLDTLNQNAVSRIKELEAPRAAAPEELEAEMGPPKFVQQLQSIEGLVEGQPAHFEASKCVQADCVNT